MDYVVLRNAIQIILCKLVIITVFLFTFLTKNNYYNNMCFSWKFADVYSQYSNTHTTKTNYLLFKQKRFQQDFDYCTSNRLSYSDLFLLKFGQKSIWKILNYNVDASMQNLCGVTFQVFVWNGWWPEHAKGWSPLQ